MSAAIALVDGNNFYAACEQSVDPSIVRQPVVVLSNNDGCIIARSPEARALGIKMGQPYFKVRHDLKRLGVTVRSSNYALYADMSQRLMRILEAYSEELEIYSIDEAFLKISRPSNHDLRPWARQLRESTYQSIGIPISIGLGTSKGQAKLANHLAKTVPDYAGIFDLSVVNDPDTWLNKVDVESVWGIGSKMARWCRIRGVNNARQLRDMSSSALHKKYGVVGIRLQHELRGHSCQPLVVLPLPKKETCVSRSFSHPITSLDELSKAISSYTVRASEKLRTQKQRAGTITIFTRTSPFIQSVYSKSATETLVMPSNDTSVLLQVALRLTRLIFKAHRPLIKAGVLMQNLHSTNHLQTNLLKEYDPKVLEKRERLMNTIDSLNHRYGNGTINWAACGLNQGWVMRREKLGSAATTRLTEIPIVYT